MVHKELEMFFIAYNLVRCLIVQAGNINDVALDRMSFKGTVDSVRQFSLAIAQARSKKKQHQLIVELLEVIARDEVPDRPRRREPRAAIADRWLVAYLEPDGFLVFGPSIVIDGNLFAFGDISQR